MDDATALSERIARRELSCVELMRETLEAIGRVNPGLNAIVSLRDGEELLAEAAERDAELARGERRGWMHGLPHAVKDLEETAGLRTTFGSPLHADFVPGADSELVRRIKGAGAIVIGKTNVPEWGYGSQTYNPVFGATRNPYDPARTVGGSSGGAAAALAAGLVPVADGSDYMGSLRNPAAFCNVYGLRPSLGRVVSPPYESAFEAVIGTTGPMARTPRDLATLLATLAGPHPAAPFSIEEDPAPLAAPLEPSDPAGLRIGWLGDLGGHLPFEDGILALCESALKRLGAEIVPVEPGFDPAAAWEAAVTIRHYDAAWLLELPREQLKPELHYEADGAAAVTVPALQKAQLTRTQVATALWTHLGDLDALALPSAQVFPFDVETHWPKEIAGRPMPTYHRWMECMIHASLAGLPAASAPAGFNEAGLPMGLQLIGRPRGDRALLELVEGYDRAAGPEWGALPMSRAPSGS
jgi:amidase